MRVAVWVAVHHRAAPSKADRSRAMVQIEPIRTTATRAANAVRVRALPGFKSPSLRRSRPSPWTYGRGSASLPAGVRRLLFSPWSRREDSVEHGMPVGYLGISGVYRHERG